MQTIPTFRSDAEADLYAEKHRPFAQSLKFDVCKANSYMGQYGPGAWQAVGAGLLAALNNDDHSLHLSMIALSHRLFNDRPELFEPKDPKGARRGDN